MRQHRASGKCRHFNGLRHDRCEAGAVYLDVVQVREGKINLLPCFAWDGERSDTCGAYEPLTELEQAEEDRKTEEAINDVLRGNVCGMCGENLQVHDGEMATVKSCPEHGIVMRECRSQTMKEEPF